MMRAAGCDWTVSKRPLALVTPPAEDDEDGEFAYSPVPGHKALVRDSDGKIFDVVSDRWTPVQNAEVFRFFHDFCASGAATMETAGSLKGGEIVWGLANLGHGFTLPGGDAVKGYLALLSRHKSGYATIGRVTPVRVVCANTLAMSGGFGKAGHEVRYAHVGEEFDADRARAEIGLAHEGMDAFTKAAHVLQSINLGRDDAARILAPIYQPEIIDADGFDDTDGTVAPLRADWAERTNRTVEGIMKAALSGPGADVVGMTGWGWLNAATYYANHKARGTADSRFTSALIGDSNTKVNRLASRLLELAD
jgi:phage/plasmid-like protein (TIGR03299 family)